MGAAAAAVVIANGGAARLGSCGTRSGSSVVGAAQRQQHIRPKVMAAARLLTGSFTMTIGSALRQGFKQLRELVRRGGTMMSISGFAYRIGAVSNISAKAARRALRTAAVPLIGAAIALGAFPACAQDQEQVKVAFAHALPNVEGKRLVAVTVTYPPGAKSLAHQHAASAFIYAYVLSGTIRSQVGDEPAKIYHACESFYEMPGSHHRVSENASDKESASLLAVFVVDSKDEPLTTPDKAPGSQ